jgi:hypothetical protein
MSFLLGSATSPATSSGTSRIPLVTGDTDRDRPIMPPCLDQGGWPNDESPTWGS